MPVYNAPSNGGTVRGSLSNDTIYGSANADILWGLGGNDIIYGGDGDDSIEGDGSATYADVFASGGAISRTFTGGVSSLTGLQLVSLGGHAGKSIWAIRNASDTLSQTVTLQSASNGSGNSGGYSLMITIPPNTEILVASSNLGTHKLYYLGQQIQTVSYNSGLTFNANVAAPNNIEGDDILYGGNGNDTIRGHGGNDTLYGDAGNDKLDGGDGDDVIYGGDGDDVITGGRGDDKMYGGAGNDTFLVEWATTGDYYDGGEGIDTFKIGGEALENYVQEIDLQSGTNNWGDTFVSIENIIGGTGNDKFWGTADVNVFWGGLGNDLLDGRGGDDELYGEAGDDTLIGGDGNDKLYGGDGDDVLEGGAGTDTLFGDGGSDRLYGGDGTDYLTGGTGADHLDGGAGVDTAVYRYSPEGVTVNLLTGAGFGGDAEGDTLVNIENIKGSAYEDVLIGDDGVNRLNGMSGADELYGMGGNDWILTGGGYDYIDGGDGIDTVSYEDSWDRVEVNLATGTGRYGSASRDVIVNVENIYGSEFGDKLTGDSGVNRLNGQLGNDIIDGGGGNDYIIGGEGNDTLTGGAGADVFIFETNFGNDTITDFWAGTTRTDRIWFQGVGFDDFSDVLANAVDTAAGAVISVAGHGSITLTGVSIAQLHADDFIFG
jgi:Ca2+-binding RTX toxin-like protein